MKKRNLLSGFLSVGLLLALVSCGTKADNTSTPASSAETESSSQSEVIDYGTVTINDIEVTFMNEVIINPVFEKEEYEEELAYTFEGNNISIVDGKVKGLVAGSETVVTAKSEHFSTTFKVNVSYINASLTNPTGAESKFSVPVPQEERYVMHFDVECETIIDSYTRLSSFAFNASDNSWYNIEMGGDGNIHLFAKFNGIEKYWNLLGHRSEFTIDGKIQYKIDIMKDGQATYFLFNNKVVAGYTAEEMQGYAPLGALEVTAAADRENAGLYKINLNNVYYELENSQNYQDLYTRKAREFPNVTLEDGDAGAERAFRFGSVALFQDMVLSVDVEVEAYAANRTRLAAFAFNRSDNSWYNIEMGDDGVIFLFGHFNGVEKYWIRLAHKNDVTVDGKICFNVKIMKQGQATWYFFNDKLVCWFQEHELKGYGKLETLEVSAQTGSWGGGAYKINLKNMKMENKDSQTYVACMGKVYGDFPNATLASNNGAEQRAPELPASDCMIFSARVEVKQDSTGWFRPSAFAFNNSDNSWYNIETDAGGAMTLYAKFNGVEKYGIALGTKAETTKDGVFAYDIVILKVNQATHFFYNGVLKCSFSETELNGYPGLFCLNITASADRVGSAFEVEVQNQKIENESSAKYQEYLGKLA